MSPRVPTCSVLVGLALLAGLGACEAGVVTVMIDGPLGERPMPMMPSVDAGTRPADTVTFRSEIQRDLVDSGCTGCHGISDIPMSLHASPTSETEWRENYEEVLARAGSAGTSALIDKALGDGSHGIFFAEDSPVVGRWRAWIADGAPFDAEAPVDDPPGTPPPGPVDAGTSPPDAGGGGGGGPLTFGGDVEPIIEANGCRRCHGDHGRYSLETYGGVTGTGSDDVPNVIPGDDGSKLAAYCRRGHQGIGYADALVIMEWIVEWDAAP